MLQYLLNRQTPFYTFLHFNKMKFLIIGNVFLNLLQLFIGKVNC